MSVRCNSLSLGNSSDDCSKWVYICSCTTSDAHPKEKEGSTFVSARKKLEKEHPYALELNQ
jgi:hypothetical protein